MCRSVDVNVFYRVSLFINLIFIVVLSISDVSELTKYMYTAHLHYTAQ